MPPKSHFKWDDALERKFLLAIIQREGISVSAKYCDEIVEELGIETTGNALRQRFDKMKKEIIGAGGGEGGIRTPTKKAATAGGEESEKKSTGKRKAATKKTAGMEDDGESPTKKIKPEKEETPEAH